jgi:hypothetical protein
VATGSRSHVHQIGDRTNVQGCLSQPLTTANVITVINGETVRDASDAKRLLAESPLDAEITVLNIDRGTERTYRTRLAPNATARRRNSSGGSSSSGSSAGDWMTWPDSSGGSSSSTDTFDGGAFRQQMDWNNFNRNYSRNPDHAPVGR